MIGKPCAFRVHHQKHQDTVKIYCTEDTPLNFSRSSSLSDLTGKPLWPVEERFDQTLSNVTAGVNQKQTDSKHGQVTRPVAMKRTIFDEDCVKVYQTEDIPINFSLSSSISDLRIIDDDEIRPEIVVEEEEEEYLEEENDEKTDYQMANSNRNGEENPNVYLETPLVLQI